MKILFILKIEAPQPRGSNYSTELKKMEYKVCQRSFYPHDALTEHVMQVVIKIVNYVQSHAASAPTI
jgi:hypothetical protein